MDYGERKFRDSYYLPWDKKIIYPNGDFVEIWWSPGRKEYSIQSRIIDLIKNAEETIDVGVTIFDSNSIASNLIKKAKEGVRIRIIVDQLTIDDENSNIPALKEKIEDLHLDNIEIIKGGTAETAENPVYSIYHHHDIIIDNKIVLSGTANWTYGGFFLNDENFLIFYSPEIAQKFTKMFEEYLDYKNILKQNGNMI
jgi:phosphatidylserine/phosphatidylglycerophosphate/cardiolipin synthase-like enzyme